jgi:hypothetical protein
VHETSNIAQAAQVGAGPLRWIAAGAFYVVILASGFWLARTGKPYGGIVFNLHKLVSLAGIVALGITIYRTGRAGALGAIEWTVAIAAGAFFLGTMVTGGLLSLPIDLPMPAVVGRLHRVTPYLTALSTAAGLYLLRGR